MRDEWGPVEPTGNFRADVEIAHCRVGNARLREELFCAKRRINDLLEANNRYLMRARAAEWRGAGLMAAGFMAGASTAVLIAAGLAIILVSNL